MWSLRLNGVDNVEDVPVAADAGTRWAYYSMHVGSNGGLVDNRDLLAHPGVVVPTFAHGDIVTYLVGSSRWAWRGGGRVVKGAQRPIAGDRPS